MTTFYSHVTMAGGASGVLDNPYGKKFHVGTTKREGAAEPQYATIASAEAKAQSGDSLVIQNGTYTEDVTFNVSGLTVRAGALGGYPDVVVIKGKTVVSACRNVTFRGIEFFSNSSTFPCVRLGASSDSANAVTSVLFEDCSFSSDGSTTPPAGALVFGGLHITFRRCRFVNLTHGILIHPTSGEFPYGVKVENCEFSEITTSCVADLVGSFDSSIAPISRSGVGSNFLMRDNTVVTAPTTQVNIGTVGTSTGLMTGNRWAVATNSNSAIVIPSGILYPTNYTEAGASTARPA